MPKFKIDLNVLNHLGLSLYTNTPAVLTEIVSNAWDADATEVHISVDDQENQIIIEDNGHGMTYDDVENKFLNVGYARRSESEGRDKTPNQRQVMGRKGIGKLAMFSLANVVEVYTKFQNEKSVALKINVEELQTAIKNGSEYETQSIDSGSFGLEHGTRIILSDIHKNIKKTASYLKKHLSRRFSILGEQFNFRVFLNNDEITIDDRGYSSKLQFLWRFGNQSKDFALNVDPKYNKALHNTLSYESENFEITGFIGSVKKPSELKDVDVSNNAITILANGRIFQENILDELDNAKIFTSYLVGEINADFLDATQFDDMAISSRQGLRQNDLRYQALRLFIETALRTIDEDWDNWRREEGIKEEQKKHPKVEEWLSSLTQNRDRKIAENLIGKINTIRFNGTEQEQEDSKKEILKNSILAFEKLKVKGNLDRLEDVSIFDVVLFKPILESIDTIEESYFYDITRQRLKVIEKFNNLVDENQKEKVVQEYLYKHLWLLDPSWERTTESYIEQPLSDELKAILPEIEGGARVDIAYKAVTGKHIIIEMKRPLVKTTIFDLVQQGSKYRAATKEWYRNNQGQNDLTGIEIYFLIGKQSKSKIYSSAEQSVVDSLLESINARILTYDELITKANQSYNVYLQNNSEVKRIQDIIDNI